jgi:hypothetical protein
MKSLQDQVDAICKLADEVITNPNLPVKTTAKNIGLGATIVGFAAGGALVPLPLMGFSPLLALGMWAAKKIKDREKAHQEKELMLREIIKKQQAVIRELQNRQAKNAEEIKNLKRMLEMLEETESVVKKAA